MVFNSLTFVVFFAVMLVMHHLPLTWKVKKINLLLASYLFYAAWNPPFILLLWHSTVIDFFVGKALYTQQNPYKKNIALGHKPYWQPWYAVLFQIWHFPAGKFCSTYIGNRAGFPPGQTKYHFTGGNILLYFHYALLYN